MYVCFFYLNATEEKMSAGGKTVGVTEGRQAAAASLQHVWPRRRVQRRRVQRRRVQRRRIQREAGSEEAGSEEAGSEEEGSEEAGSEEAGSAEAGSEEAGSEEAGSEEAGSAGQNGEGYHVILPDEGNYFFLDIYSRRGIFSPHNARLRGVRALAYALSVRHIKSADVLPGNSLGRKRRALRDVRFNAAAAPTSGKRL